MKIEVKSAQAALQVSKWLKIQVLLAAEEMERLLEALGEVYFARVSGPVVEGEMVLMPEQFLEGYRSYCEVLKRGEVPEEKAFRSLFSTAMTSCLEAFYAMPVGKEKYLIKPREPVVQLQAHHFFYSPLDKEFHSMVFSPESISWGLQFSYPQWMQDPITYDIHKVKDQPSFTNTALFSKLMQWMRTHTLPTPLIVEGKKRNVPIRIGKAAGVWVHNHVQLKKACISSSFRSETNCSAGAS